jgi:uncharacterized protein (UPF0179 family)
MNKMDDNDTLITLIGSRLAKEGVEFIFEGETKECQKCKMKNTCMNLEKGRRYGIINVRHGVLHECFIHDKGVLVVEVVKSPVITTIGSRKAVEGAGIRYEPIKCNEFDCSMYELCHPLGLMNGDKCTITSVLGNIDDECAMGYSLKKVELKF